MTAGADAETRVIHANVPAPETRAIDLVVLTGPDAGKRVRVAGGSARIGTNRGNELCLTDRAVSRIHCEIAVRRGAVTLRDAGSTNGTFVDGRRVRDIDLTDGSVVRLGETSIRIEPAPAAASTPAQPRDRFGELVGSSAEMQRLYSMLERVAQTDSTVLVLGETGTGKEVVARSIHDGSARARAPFVTLDCGAIPESLIESELFGHVRGAFTGASTDRRGVFEEADGGTLFIDEIGELPLMMQPKLLRALEARRIRRVGANTYVPINVRVIAATHRSLYQSVNHGTFRDDLYYRLAVVELEVPPLRARIEDIPVLAAHFLEQLTGSPATPSPEMLSTLAGRSWKGNVRELRNVIERSLSLGWDATAASLRPQPLQEGPAHASIPTHLPLKEARVAWVEQFETVYVRALLERSHGNVTRAAAMAGVNRRFLQRMMARLGIRGTDPNDDEA
ncbi:MAG: sigma 54-interacting transcriptional regulator [Polyangiaceae bacterium]|nr:sigma 54-interacting transcriptional regulator [Polyangiaceae bacterium]